MYNIGIDNIFCFNIRIQMNKTSNSDTEKTLETPAGKDGLARRTGQTLPAEEAGGVFPMKRHPLSGAAGMQQGRTPVMSLLLWMLLNRLRNW